MKSSLWPWQVYNAPAICGRYFYTPESNIAQPCTRVFEESRSIRFACHAKDYRIQVLDSFHHFHRRIKSTYYCRSFIFDSRSTAELICSGRFVGGSFNRRRRVFLITFSGEAAIVPPSKTWTREDGRALSRVYLSGFSRLYALYVIHL